MASADWFRMSVDSFARPARRAARLAPGPARGGRALVARLRRAARPPGRVSAGCPGSYECGLPPPASHMPRRCWLALRAARRGTRLARSGRCSSGDASPPATPTAPLRGPGPGAAATSQATPATAGRAARLRRAARPGLRAHGSRAASRRAPRRNGTPRPNPWGACARPAPGRAPAAAGSPPRAARPTFGRAAGHPPRQSEAGGGLAQSVRVPVRNPHPPCPRPLRRR